MIIQLTRIQGTDVLAERRLNALIRLYQNGMVVTTADCLAQTQKGQFFSNAVSRLCQNVIFATTRLVDYTLKLFH